MSASSPGSKRQFFCRGCGESFGEDQLEHDEGKPVCPVCSGHKVVDVTGIPIRYDA